jgi:hypothetical protein
MMLTNNIIIHRGVPERSRRSEGARADGRVHILTNYDIRE